MNRTFGPLSFVTDTDSAKANPWPLPFVIVESKHEWGMTIERAELRQVTDTGMIVRSLTVRPLPEEISFYFPDDGLQRVGHVRWHAGRLFGIEMSGSEPLPARWRRRNHGANRPVLLDVSEEAGCRIDF